MSLIQLNLN